MGQGDPPTDPHAETAVQAPGSAQTLPARESGEPRELVPGERIGRFEVKGILGRGGMGVVYEAYDAELDRPLAIKFIRRGSGSDGSLSDRLRREAKAAARLKHPNVVSVYDVGVHEGDSYIAMELVRGITLRAWLAETERPWADTLRVFTDAARGLQAAHAAGMVHRDFKPDNVLVEGDRVCVLDFGLARDLASDMGDVQADSETAVPVGVTITQTGAVVGTPRYMSPEQRLGKRADHRSDQYSFCVALYEALYGEHPFEGDNVAVPPQPKGSPIPARIHAALARGLAMEPAKRFARMSSLLEALRPPSATPKRWWLLAGASILVLGGALVFALLRGAGHSPASNKESVEDAYARGRKLLSVGRPSEAADAFLKAYRIGGDPNMLLNAVTAYERADRPCDALNWLNQYVYDVPGAADRVAKRGAALRSHVRRLGRTCKDSPKRSPELVEAKTSFDVAQDLFLREQYLAAARAFELTYAKRGFHQFLFNVGVSLSKSGRFCEAVPYLRRAAQDAGTPSGIMEPDTKIEENLALCLKLGPLSPSLLADELMRGTASDSVAYLADMAAMLDRRYLSSERAYLAWKRVGGCPQQLRALARFQGDAKSTSLAKTYGRLKAECAPPPEVQWEKDLRVRTVARASDAVLKDGRIDEPTRRLMSGLLLEHERRCEAAKSSYQGFLRASQHSRAKALVRKRLEHLLMSEHCTSAKGVKQ